MKTIIGFESNSRKALSQLETWPDLPPSQCAFWLPEEARDGDRVLWFVGGKLNSYVAIGKIEGRWSRRGGGDWTGVWRIGTSDPRQLDEFVPGEEVALATGFKAPTDAGVVPRHLERAVLNAVRRKPFDAVARALEGAATEAKSRRRNQALRTEVLRRAGGICEVCQTNFARLADGLGSRCLVVHHTKQLRDYDQPKETRLGDLAVVCANCHMMIHADSRRALSTRQLKKRLGVRP